MYSLDFEEFLWALNKPAMDFFIRHKRTATAVEVKSAEKAASKSMTSMIKNYNVKRCPHMAWVERHDDEARSARVRISLSGAIARST